MSLPTTDIVNSISIENAFWAQVVNGRFSFSLEDIQKDVHFTLSAHDNSANINFHVTRNVDANKNNKPKHTVFEMDKSILSAFDAHGLTKKLIDCLFVPFRPIKWESRRNRKHVFAAFIPNVENEARIKSDFVSYLKPYYRVQRKKLKVHSVDQLSANEEQLLKLKQILPIAIRRFRGRMPEGCLFGMMLTPEENFLVINMNGKLLRLKRGLSVMQVLTELVGEKLARKLLRKVNKAIVLVRNATSYDEVASLHDPIKLDLKL